MSAPFGDALVERAAAVRTRADFAAFVQLLLRNYREHPEEWENATLDAFLGGLCGFADGMEGYYANIGVPVNPDAPSWRVVADTLLAARVYE
jgi:hypothetical protein